MKYEIRKDGRKFYIEVFDTSDLNILDEIFEELYKQTEKFSFLYLILINCFNGDIPQEKFEEIWGNQLEEKSIKLEKFLRKKCQLITIRDLEEYNINSVSQNLKESTKDSVINYDRNQYFVFSLERAEKLVEELEAK